MSGEVQSSAFPDLAPEVSYDAAASQVSALQPRSPGWVLVADRNGPKGFHRVKTVGTEGSVRTSCGIVGHPISESERMIVPCAACEAVLSVS